MKTLDIRRAEIADAEAIRDINARALGYEYDMTEARAQLETLLAREDCALFVCGAPAVGYAHICDYITTYMPPLANILALGVLPEAQGAGAARALMTAAEDWAKARGLRGIRLTSGWDRAGAHQFYLKMGFADRKNQKNFVKLF